MGAAWADSWYDALQVKVTKRFSHGLDFTANYTLLEERSQPPKIRMERPVSDQRRISIAS